LPSLQQLCRNLQGSSNLAMKQHEEVTRFQRLLENKFPTTFAALMEEENDDEEESDDDDHNDNQGLAVGMTDDDGSSDDEDAPVVVDMEDVEASLARSSNNNATSRIDLPAEIQRAYPLLVAAVQPTEDILMTCARVLDEKTDVSLVREAAAYLEDIEQR
jgi:hypothetical protein